MQRLRTKITRQLITDIRELCLRDLGRQLYEGTLNSEEALRILQDIKKGRVVFNIPVNYSRSVKEGVEAGGYKSVHPDITSENFPTDKWKGTAKVVVELIHLDRDVSLIDEVFRELEGRGCRPADIQEFLALGEGLSKIKRNFQLNFSINALYLILNNGKLYFPRLFINGSELCLELSQFPPSLEETDWFEVVPK